MPRVYVHVRPHERLDLTSHLTGSRRGQSRAAVASTFTIWVANAQAELVAGTTITTVDPEAAASVGSDLGLGGRDGVHSRFTDCGGRVGTQQRRAGVGAAG